LSWVAHLKPLVIDLKGHTMNEENITKVLIRIVDKYPDMDLDIIMKIIDEFLIYSLEIDG
jgi:hypothetical protein